MSKLEEPATQLDIIAGSLLVDSLRSTPDLFIDNPQSNSWDFRKVIGEFQNIKTMLESERS